MRLMGKRVKRSFSTWTANHFPLQYDLLTPIARYHTTYYYQSCASYGQVIFRLYINCLLKQLLKDTSGGGNHTKCDCHTNAKHSRTCWIITMRKETDINHCQHNKNDKAKRSKFHIFDCIN